MFIIIILLLILTLTLTYEHFVILYEGPTPPKLFVYCDKPNIITNLCKKSIYKHCSLSFDIVYLNKHTISQYLHTYNPNNKNNIKILLLEKYGGLFLEPNILVIKNPIILIDRLNSVNTFSIGNSIIASNKGPITNINYNQFTNKFDTVNLIENKPTKDTLFVEINQYHNYNLTENDLLFSNTTLGAYLRSSIWLTSNNNY